MTRLLFLCLALLFSGSLSGQETTAPKDAAPAVTDPLESEKIRALRVLTESMRAFEAERTAQRELLKKATAEEQKKEITAEIERLSAKIKELKSAFTTTATGINPDQSQSQNDAPLSINEELRNIFQPAIRELRDATAQPREIESLKIQVVQWTSKLALAKTALAQIDLLLKENTSEEVAKELTSARKSWEKKLLEAETSLANTSVQLEERTRSAPSVVSLLAGMIAHFWKNRGLSLLLAVLALIITFLALRRTYRELTKYSPIHKKYQDSLTPRLVDVFANVFIVVASIFATVLTLYIRNDWLLLTVVSIMFLGLAWASRTALPPYFEQIRLVLNLGTVREGERIIYNGLPWRVDSLNFFCVLHNPDLNGATLRLPAKTLLTSFSRPSLPKESWFPCRTDDWVILDDGVMGKVVQQTPEQVVLVKLGGSYKTYPTLTFLSKNPENISPQFSVSTTFGLDYQYQRIATTEVPSIFQRKIYQTLVEQFGKDLIRSVNVEFASASASSLDFRITANVSGELAPQFNVIQRLLQRGAVDAANENNWVIPFPQLTVHQPSTTS
jgi:small-conductance mechanosensitive channel